MWKFVTFLTIVFLASQWLGSLEAVQSCLLLRLQKNNKFVLSVGLCDSEVSFEQVVPSGQEGK